MENENLDNTKDLFNFERMDPKSDFEMVPRKIRNKRKNLSRIFDKKTLVENFGKLDKRKKSFKLIRKAGNVQKGLVFFKSGTNVSVFIKFE